LVFTHKPLRGVLFKNHSKAPHSFRVELVVEEYLRLKIGVYILFAETDRIIEIDGKLLEYSRVIVLRNLPFLTQLDLVNL